MSWRPSPRRAAVGLLFVACACSAPGNEAPRVEGRSEAIRIVDGTGVEVLLHAPARRIVSLVPSATQTLHAMGRGDVLIGRTDYDTQVWASHLASVGGGLEPNLEAIVALRPDLVVRFAGEQDTRTPARLAELGIPQLAVRPDRIDDIYATATLLGLAIGGVAAADSFASAIRSGLAEASASVRGLPRLRVVYVLGGTPPWVAGAGTYIDEVISLMGGDNVFADLDLLYASVSPEQLRARPVDVVLLSEPGTFDPALTPDARVELVGTALEIPGPGVVDAAYLVAERMHGRKLR
jgi:ABC-type Fe3+-hydroxamate transport system substrate-binding protein